MNFKLLIASVVVLCSPALSSDEYEDILRSQSTTSEPIKIVGTSRDDFFYQHSDNSIEDAFDEESEEADSPIVPRLHLEGMKTQFYMDSDEDSDQNNESLSPTRLALDEDFAARRTKLEWTEGFMRSSSFTPWTQAEFDELVEELLKIDDSESFSSSSPCIYEPKKTKDEPLKGRRKLSLQQAVTEKLFSPRGRNLSRSLSGLSLSSIPTSPKRETLTRSSCSPRYLFKKKE